MQEDEEVKTFCSCTKEVGLLHKTCLEKWAKQSSKRTCDFCKDPYKIHIPYRTSIVNLIWGFFRSLTFLKQFIKSDNLTIVENIFWLLLIIIPFLHFVDEAFNVLTNYGYMHPLVRFKPYFDHMFYFYLVLYCVYIF